MGLPSAMWNPDQTVENRVVNSDNLKVKFVLNI